MARGIGPTLGTATTDRISGPTLPKLPQASISAWILVNGLGGTSSGAIVANTNNASFNWGIGVVTNTSTLRVRARGWSTQIGTWTAPLGAGGTWQHIVVTYDHSSTGNNPVVFVNGISQTVTRTQAPTGTFTNSPQPVAIGCEVSNAFNFDGLIAHVAWWNGILLSAPDALALASGVSPLMVRPDSLTFYVPLDGVSNPEPDMVGSPWSLLGTRSTVSEPPDTTGNLIALEPKFNFRAAAAAIVARRQRAMVLA